MPNLQTLFGSLDLCKCKDCRSVLSPAAYLLDTFNFLDQLSRHELFERRPDLAEIELSCENTNTEVPYIDLVSEVLEYAVKPPNGHPGDPPKDGWPQTTWTAAELSANPEHINVDAYEELCQQVYSWDLPFDLWAEEARVYLAQLGTQRYELMAAFQNESSLTANIEIATEYLHLTGAEWKIITGGLVTLAAVTVATTPAEAQITLAGTKTIDGVALKDRERVLVKDRTDEKQNGIYNVVTNGPWTRSPDASSTMKTGTIVLVGGGATNRRTRWITSSGGAIGNPLKFSKLSDTRGLKALAPVKVATTTNISSLSSLTKTVDNVTLFDGDRVLVKDQGDRKANGIYIYSSTGPWRRAAGVADGDKLPAGLFVWVRGGATNIHTRWMLNASVKVGTDSLDLTRLNFAGDFDAKDSHQPWDFWGFTGSQNDWPEALSNEKVSGFLKRSGLTYADLLILLATDYVNPGREIFVEFTGATNCDLGKATLKNLTEAATNRFHRFVRLQRKLGWNSGELDMTITALKPGDLTDRFLLELANLQWLRTELNVPMANLLSWGADLDTAGDVGGNQSLYEQLFQNKAVTQIEKGTDAFELNTDRTELARAGAKISERVPGVIAALGISSADLSLLTDNDVAQDALKLSHAEISDDKLNLANLSRLYRFVSLAKALRLSVSELLSLKAISGISPFRPAHFEKARRFVEMARKVRESGFSIEELNYVLRHVAPEGRALAPDEKGIGLLLKELQTGLQKIAADTNKVSDPSGELLRAELATIFSGRLLKTAMSVIAGTSVLNDARQAGFIDRNFAPFLGDTTEAKKNLVGNRAVLTGNEDRFKFVLQGYLRWSLGESFVAQNVGAALKLETALTRHLLTRALKSPRPANDALFNPWRTAMAEFLESNFINDHVSPNIQITTFVKLYKAALMIQKLRITIDRLGTPSNAAWYVELGPRRGWLNLNSLPLDPAISHPHLFAAWTRTLDLFRLWDKLRPGNVTPFEIFDKAPHDRAGMKDYLDSLSGRIGWDRGDLEALAGISGSLGLKMPDGYADERILMRLKNCFDLVKQLGVSARQVQRWTNASLTSTEAREIRQALKAKYDEVEWTRVAKPLRNDLRERQRAALVSCLLSRSNLFHDLDDLFEYFLIDVEMSSCQTTSRIKQAIGSVQLFINRSLMNLESGSLSAEKARQWTTWRKNYRLWEANRKVFLYPENWIEPNLRDDKTPFFKELENQLLQAEVTNEAAEDAFLSYLEKLDAVARLEIAGIYHDQDVDVLHVFGRTWGTPHQYYYRQLIDASRWTPWEKVDLDIQGDHLIPVVWNRRLHLFWPVFTQKADAPSDEQRKNNAEPPHYLEIQLTWSEYKNKKWSAKRIIPKDGCFKAESLDSGSMFLDRSRYMFKAEVEAQTGDLLVRCIYLNPEPAYPGYFVIVNGQVLGFSDKVQALGINEGVFRLTGCSGEVQLQIVQIFRPGGPLTRQLAYEPSDSLSFLAGQPAIPDGCHVDYMTFQERVKGITDIGEPDSLNLIQGDGTNLEILKRTPGIYRVLYPHQYDQFVSQDYCFYEDDKRTFFVAPTTLEVNYAHPNTISIEAISVTRGHSYEVAGMGAIINPLGRRPEPSGSLQLAKSEPVAAGAAISRLSPNGGSQQEFVSLGDVDQSHGAMGFVQLPFPGNVTSYEFQTFYHPYVCEAIRRLNRNGIEGLLRWPIEPRPTDSKHPIELVKEFFVRDYAPVASRDVVKKPYPQDTLDFSHEGWSPYSQYNWELFFHVPLLIADRLSKNQQFEEARQWFHYIFDPTDRSDYATPARFWKMRGFFDDATKGAPQTLQELMDSIKQDAALRAQVRQWADDPFDPHLIARMRTVAYQKTVVMKYIDNLIAWGDQLFRRETLEALNEATHLYVLAADILGARPAAVPSPAKTSGKETYNNLKANLDQFSNELVAIENLAHGNLQGVNSSAGSGLEVVLGITQTPFLCIPANDKLLGYWDTVADRLFKIRHCMNIEGVVRALPLFEPPIDPALLVRARAAGIDLNSVLNEVNTAAPHYRFTMIAQKATELCADVRALGTALLSALEKRDAEKLALLRSQHEVNLLTAVRAVKENQLTEATLTLEGLKKYQEVVAARYDYYSTRMKMNAFELLHLELAAASMLMQTTQVGLLAAAADLRDVPDTKVGAPTTAGTTFGGSNLGASLEAFGSVLGIGASIATTAGSASATIGGYERRWDDWQHQADLAAKELEQVAKQILAATIRVEIAEKELENHDKQVEQVSEIKDYLHDKFTNEDLYDWMVGQTSALYFQSYQLAYDLARRAQKAFQFEVADFDASFIQFGYWDSLKKGLLAGERLHLDLKRMEVAYLDRHKREYEIAKHISLVLHDPMALIVLKESGECIVDFREPLFDMDYPGHYLRRIKNVTLTIPCVVGPYTNVNCTLTLLTDKIRIENDSHDYSNSRHFVTNFAATQSIVTSHAQNDSGLFELNFRDERYLPFEGAGVISTWRIEMPKDCNAFDFETISDVIINFNYTAREGGKLLGDEARKAAKLPSASQQPGVSAPFPPQADLLRFFSLKHEFSNEWYRFLHPADDAVKQAFQFDLTQERFPFLFRRQTIKVTSVELFLKFKDIRDPKVFKLDKDNPTPFGDYAITINNKPLTLRIKPPQTDEVSGKFTQLTLELPHADFSWNSAPPLTKVPGVDFWSLEARQEDVRSIGATLQTSEHLNPEVIEDIYMICHYSVN